MIRILFLLCGLIASRLPAAPTTNEPALAGIAEFTAAYREWNGPRFSAAVELFRLASRTAPPNVTNYYWLGAAQFHQMLQMLGENTNQPAARTLLEETITSLNTAVTLDEKHAESHALLGTLYGMKIADKFIRAAWLGPRLMAHSDKALANGPTNPRVKYLQGMSQFYTSSRAAGWSEALGTLLEAEKLFEAEGKVSAAPLEPRWGHDSCLTFIGSSYEKLGQQTMAAAYFRRALVMHPKDQLAIDGLARVTKTINK